MSFCVACQSSYAAKHDVMLVCFGPFCFGTACQQFIHFLCIILPLQYIYMFSTTLQYHLPHFICTIWLGMDGLRTLASDVKCFEHVMSPIVATWRHQTWETDQWPHVFRLGYLPLGKLPIDTQQPYRGSQIWAGCQLWWAGIVNTCKHCTKWCSGWFARCCRRMGCIFWGRGVPIGSYYYPWFFPPFSATYGGQDGVN